MFIKIKIKIKTNPKYSRIFCVSMFKFLIKYCKYLLSDTELGSFTILINGPIDPIQIIQK